MADTIRFGTVGTGWIVDRFIAAGAHDSRFCVSAAYSRTEQSGQSFAQKHGIPHVYTSLQEMAESGQMDAIYIASPTGLHHEHTRICLQSGVPVLCEKPFTSTAAQAQELYALAAAKKLPLLHAMRPLFEPRMQAIASLVPSIGLLRQVSASRCRYSSRYDDFKAGELPNAFNASLGGGAAMDIGIYLIQPTIALLGAPRTQQSDAVLLPGGIDGAGSLLLGYGDKQASLSFSKISNSHSVAEIQGEDGSLCWEVNPKKNTITISIYPRKGDAYQLVVDQPKPSMYYEIAAFLDMVQSGQVASDVSRPADVIAALQVLDTYNRQIQTTPYMQEENHD